MKINHGWRLNIWVFIPRSWYSYIHCWRSTWSATWIPILSLHKAKNYDILAEGKGVMDSGSGKLWILTTASCTLAWKLPWTEEPGGLPSMGSHRVGHDWSDLAAAATNTHFLCSSSHKDFSNTLWFWMPPLSHRPSRQLIKTTIVKANSFHMALSKGSHLIQLLQIS